MEKYLERCVDSLIKQTYSHIEILLIDDGSADGSLKLCQEYEKQDNRIRVYYSAMYLGKEENVNCGQETTRNCGLEKARGEYIMFLDSDDVFSLDAIEKMVTFAQSNDADMVFASFTEIIKENIQIKKAEIDDGVYKKKDFTKYCFEKIPFMVMSCIGSKIYKRSLIEDNGIRFDRYYRYNEDAAFMLNCLIASERVGYINLPFYHYFIRNSGSTQTSYRENMFENIMRTYDLCRTFLSKNGALEEKKCYLSKLIVNLALNTLINEIKFKDYSQYKKEFYSIKKRDDFAEARALVKNNSLGERIMLFSMKSNLPVLFYAVTKIRGI